MVEVITDIEAAQRSLLDGTISPYEFDQKYGRGSSNDVMKGTYKTPEQLEAVNQQLEQDQQGFFENLWDNVSEVPSAIVRGMIGAPTEMLETTANANSVTTDQADNLYEKTINYRNEVLAKRGLPAMTPEEEADFAQRMGVGLASGGMAVRDERVDFDTNDVVKAINAEEYLPEPTTIVGGLTEGISQFVTGFAMLGGGNTLAGAMLKGGVVDATAFDPYEANLSSFLEESGWAKNAVTEALKTDPNSPEWENRLRNSLEGGIAGAALEGIIRGIKFVAVGRKAKTEIKELGKITDETADELDQVHQDAVDAEDQITNTQENALVAKPDGTFEAPDGTTYKPDGEVLTEVNTSAVDEPVAAKPADNLEAPKAPEDAPQALPDAPVRTEVDTTAPDQPKLTADEQAGVDLKAQVEPEVIKVNPKIELINKQAFDDALNRAAEMGDFDLRSMDEGAQFNFERMEGPVEAAKVIDSFQEILQNSKGFKQMGLDKPQSHQEVVKSALSYIAENTGTDVNKIIRDLNVRETISRDMASRIVAGKMALQSTGREIDNLAHKLEALEVAGKSTEELDRQLVDLMQMHVELQANVKGLQTSAARATAAGRITTQDALTMGSLDKLAAFGGSSRVRQLAKQLRSIKDDAARAKYIKKAVERKWLRVLNEYWINSILSGYTTHALNMTSNSINLLIRPAERAVGATLTGNFNEAGTALKTYVYLGAYLKDSLVMAAKSGWNHRAILDEAVKVETLQTGGANPRAISADFLGVKNKPAATVIDILGKGLTLPSRALGTEDEFFKQLSFRSYLRANIVADSARMTGDQLKQLGYRSRQEFIDSEFTKAFETKVSAEERWQEMVITGKVVDDPKVKEEFVKRTIGSANAKSKYASAALEEARQTTFTNPLEKGTLSYDLQVLANRNPILRQIIPFIQTPMNIMYQAWDRTPLLNLLRRKYKDELFSSDPNVRSQAAGKMALGLGMYGTLTFLAAEGRITGGGPTDSEMAKLYRNSKDWQPYSLNVGTPDEPYWISFERMDPWTTAFGIVGDINEMIQMGQMSDADASSYTAMTIAAMGNNLVSKTYLQGISDIVTALNSKDRPWELENLLKRRAASMTPFSSFVGQTANANDDYLREVRSVLDQLRKQTGFQRDQLPVKYDWITGEPLEKPENMLGYIKVKSLSREDKDVALVNSEMRKIGYQFNGPQKSISGVRLSGEQFQRFNQLVGSTEIGGKKLVDRLVSRINSDRYRKDDDDYNLVSPKDSHRTAILNREIIRYRDRAERILMKEYPELRQAIRDYKRYTDLTKRGRIGVKPEIDMENLD